MTTYRPSRASAQADRQPMRSRVTRLIAAFRNRNTIIFAAVILVSVLYLWETHRVAATGFAVTDLERQRLELLESNRKLEIQTAELRSLARIRASASAAGLVETDTVEYLTASGSTVAKAP